MTALRVTAGQFSPTADKNTNLSAISALVAQAASDGSRLVLLPEYSSYFDPELSAAFVERAEPLTGRFVTVLEHLAREHSLWLVAGMNERIPDSARFRNTIVVVDPAGTVQSLYRKIHLYDAFGHAESDREEPGDPAQVPVFEIDGVRVGVQTCYDLRFPEISRRLVDAGAELLLVPSQWVPGPMKEEHWATLLAARAIENTVYVLAAGQTAPNGCGHSRLLGPMGEFLAGAGTRPGLCSGAVDSAEVERVRELNPALALRRLQVVPGAPSACR